MTILTDQETAELQRKIEALADTLPLPQPIAPTTKPTPPSGRCTSASTRTRKESSRCWPTRERNFSTPPCRPGVTKKQPTPSQESKCACRNSRPKQPGKLQQGPSYMIVYHADAGTTVFPTSTPSSKKQSPLFSTTPWPKSRGARSSPVSVHPLCKLLWD